LELHALTLVACSYALLTSDMYATCGSASQTPQAQVICHVKLAPLQLQVWVLIQVNFDPIQEIGPKVGSGCSFEGGLFFARLWYLNTTAY